MTHSIDLIFYESSQSELSGPVIARIYVKSHSSDEEGHIFLTPDCVSVREFEGEIDRLKQELEIVRKKAKLEFAKKTNNMHAWRVSDLRYCVSGPTQSLRPST